MVKRLISKVLKEWSGEREDKNRIEAERILMSVECWNTNKQMSNRHEERDDKKRK